MQKGLAYPVNLVEDLGTVRVAFPDWDNTETFGSDREEALAMAKDLLETMASVHVSKGEAFPDPSPDLSRPTVGLCLLSVPQRLACTWQCWMQVFPRQNCPDGWGWHPPQAQKLLDLQHKSRVDQIEQALAAVGKRLVVMVQDAA